MIEINLKSESGQVKNERTNFVSFVFWFLAGLALLGLDQLAKYLAFHGNFGSFLNILAPGIKKFHYFNHNFAFSLPLPAPVMYAIYAIVLILISRNLVVSWKRLGQWARLAWVFVLTGALSNIVERMALGYVRDFIYIFSGIFNLADGYIIIGVLILLVQSFKRKT